MISRVVTVLLMNSLFIDFTAEAISCYQCNSVDNSQCENLEQWARGRTILPKPCEPFNETLPSFCRKTVLSVMQNTKVISTRVIRSCGYIRSNLKKKCYKTDNDDHLETVCQCFVDNCNSSFSLNPYKMIIFFALIVSTIIV